MINRELIDPKSIVVVGGSNNVHKPGGRLVRNLLDGKYKGELYVVNAREDDVQGLKSYHSVQDIPDTEMAIISIPGSSCPEAVDILAKQKNVKAFIVVSAGFGEETHEGAVLENQMLDSVNEAGASMIGPNCIGLMNMNFHGVFTQPIPEFHPDGVDFVSSSGGTALFIIESALTKGLRFSSVWSVGNSKQIGVEEVIEYMDRNFDPVLDSKIKMLYIEQIKNPDKLRDAWHRAYGGRNAHKVAVLEEGVKFTPISIPNNEAQFLETRKFQIEEIARMYRVPLHMIGDLDHATFSNVEHLSLDFVKYSLDPWIVRWEQSLQKALLSDSEKGQYFVKFNVDGLLRGDYASRMQGYATARQNGWMSANDIRELEDMNMISEEEGGNLYLVNGSFTKLADAGAFANQNSEKEEKTE